MGKFNLDDYYINNRGQESLRKQGQQKSPNCIFGCSLKNNRMISVHFQGKAFSITIIQVYAPTVNVEEVEVERFYEDLQDLLGLTPKNIFFSS